MTRANHPGRGEYALARREVPVQKNAPRRLEWYAAPGQIARVVQQMRTQPRGGSFFSASDIFNSARTV
jgi:hypothetical protein